MRRAVYPSGCARCGADACCSAMKYQSLRHSAATGISRDDPSKRFWNESYQFLRNLIEIFPAQNIRGRCEWPLSGECERIRTVDIRLPGEGNSNSHGARPVHHIISMMAWIRTCRLSIKNSLCERSRPVGCQSRTVSLNAVLMRTRRGHSFPKSKRINPDPLTLNPKP